MSFTPEDRGTELRALFFESANELLQSLNESGLELEARPADEEVIRSVRRVVHTLKGDSAACGFTKLSEIAHELEDVLTPQMGTAHGAKFAEIVLIAADTFEAMLSAYQRNAEPPTAEASATSDPPVAARAGSFGRPSPDPSTASPAQFEWSEYEQLMISEAIHRGESVFNVALAHRSEQRHARRSVSTDSQRTCTAAVQSSPFAQKTTPPPPTSRLLKPRSPPSIPKAHIEQRCRIPAIVAQVWVEDSAHADAAEHELLGDLLDAQAAQVSAAMRTRRKIRPLASPARSARPWRPSPKVLCAWTQRASIPS